MDLRDWPADWPHKGKLNGEEIDLEKLDAETMTDEELREIEIEIPGKGTIRPFRFSVSDGSEFGL